MGQKVHPTGIRLGIAKDWNSTWYAEKGEYAEQLKSDLEVREFLRKRLAQAAVSRIQIERPAKSARITIHTARPGIVIGKKGEYIDKLRREVTEIMGVPTHITVAEIRKPELDAKLVAEGVAQQLERRIMFRRAMKRAVGNAMRLGKVGQRIGLVVTQRIERHTRTFQLINANLQLDQLRTTRRSPHRRAKEHHGCRPTAAVPGKAPRRVNRVILLDFCRL